MSKRTIYVEVFARQAGLSEDAIRERCEAARREKAPPSAVYPSALYFGGWALRRHMARPLRVQLEASVKALLARRARETAARRGRTV